VRQLRVDWARQCCLQFVDLSEMAPQPSHMRFCIAPALFIGNDGETFCKNLGGDFFFRLF
jgi:hypothetical protein